MFIVRVFHHGWTWTLLTGMFSVNGAGFWTSGVTVVWLCVHGVATCTSSKALSELNIASNSVEVSLNRRGGSFSFDEMSADPESSNW